MASATAFAFVRAIGDYMIKNYTLRNYQKEFVDFFKEKKRVLLASPIGSGKTLMSIAAAQEMGSKKVLITCLASLKNHWKSEVETATDYKATVVEGGKADRKAIYSDYFSTNGTQVLIASYETVRNDMDILHTEKFDTIICDEVTKLKNPMTKNCKALSMLLADYKIGLSGQPIEKRVEDLFGIMKFINPRIFGNYWQFRAQFCVVKRVDLPGRRSFEKVVGYKNLEQLKSTLRFNTFIKTHEEVLPELPPRIDKTYYFTMNDEQKEAYAILREEILQKKLNPLTKVLRLRQVIDDEDGPKMDTLLDIMEDIDTTNDQVIVFSHFVEPCYAIHDKLNEIGIPTGAITGMTETEAREATLKDFKSGKLRVLVCSEVMSMGHNLQNASIVLFYSLPWSVAKYEQQAGRAWRLGQKKNVIVLNILAAGTIEERVYKILKHDSKTINAVMDSNIFQHDIESDPEAIRELFENDTAA